MLSLKFLPFNAAEFYAEIAHAASADARSISDSEQARYLASYLGHKEAGAKAMLVEAPYVDRHYLQEFAGYYATSLRPPSSHATRIHFWDEDLTEARFCEYLNRAREDYEGTCERAQERYLGFVVIRPLASAPIGRTVLRPYGSVGSRSYGPASAPYRVHLAGLELRVNGIPFQQQDQAVGACATTALWTALSRVRRNDGGRAPTPLEVTTSATRHYLAGGALPAVGGLEMAQMLAAIRDAGYSSEVMKPTDAFDLFLMAVKCYLRSGIPVVVRLVSDNALEGHAVTLVGYRESDDLEPARLLRKQVTASRELIGEGMSRVYVHDDRLGPYARMRWKELGENDLGLEFFPYESGFEAFTAPLIVGQALVPLYPKLRLSALDLIEFAGELLPAVEALATDEYCSELRVEFGFALAGDYLRDLLKRQIAEERARGLLTRAFLSRYVGVISFRLGTEWFLDVVCDTTDIRRPLPKGAPVLAIIPRAEQDLDVVRQIAAQYSTEVLVG